MRKVSAFLIPNRQLKKNSLFGIYTTQEKIVLHQVMRALASDTSTSKQLTNLYNHIILLKPEFGTSKTEKQIFTQKKEFQLLQR